MDILYITVVAILIAGTVSIEDGKTDNLQQRILLRKLQNFQETKPASWNELLADVLVNKIRIFSFTSQDKEVMKDDAPVSKDKTILTDIFSKVLYVYKKFIYDAYVGKRKESHELVHVTAIPEIEEHSKLNTEELVKPTETVYERGPKSEVELVEPKYHGKITQEDTTENTKVDVSTQRDDATNKKTGDPKVQSQDDINIKAKEFPNLQENVDSALQESVCATGFVRNENGDCVKSVSKLILAVPNQCPMGYRQDWLGNCRKIFRF